MSKIKKPESKTNGKTRTNGSKNSFHKMLDALPTAVYTTDAKGNLTYFNPAAVEFSGRKPELGNDKWCITWKLFYPDGTRMPHEECPMAVALKEGRNVFGQEAIAERPDGKRIWFMPYPSPLFDHEGNIIGGINIFVDISDRKQSEKKLRANEERFRIMMEQSPLSMQIFNAGGESLRVNPAWERLWGSPIEELEGYNILEDEQLKKAGITEDIKKAFSGETVKLPETYYDPAEIGKTGRSRWIEGYVYPLITGDSKDFDVVCVHNDVTEQKRSELLRDEQNKLLELIASGAPLEKCLTALCNAIPEFSPGVRAAVLTVDNDRKVFKRPVAPDAGALFINGFEDAEIGDPDLGTCGIAVCNGVAAQSMDITKEEDWSKEVIDICIENNIKAIHSTPVFGKDENTIASFPLLFNEPRKPDKWEYQLAEFGAHIASIAIERDQSRKNLAESEERLRFALEAGEIGSWDWDIETNIINWSDNLEEQQGMEPGGFDGKFETYLNTIHPDDRGELLDLVNKAVEEDEPYHVEHRRVKQDGDVIWVEAKGRVFRDEDGRAVRMTGTCMNINDRKRSELLQEEQNKLLELIASGAQLEECLTALCNAIPKLSSGVTASVLIADEDRKSFKRPIAPGMDSSFGDGLEGAPINDLFIGTCGTAVYEGKPVQCADISNDEKWSDEWRELCIANNLMACHSTPVFDDNGKAVASFPLFFDEPRKPDKWEYQLAEFGSHLATIAIERDRARKSMETVAARLKAQKEAFQAAADGAPLEESLDILIRNVVEEAEGDARAAFYIVDDDGSCLHPVAKTSDMSEAYTQAVDGFPIGEDSLSCGLASHTGDPILTKDVYEEPLWKPVLDLAEKGGFRACWSFPTETVAGEVVGSFAMYYGEPREATARDRELADIVTQTAAIIISRQREFEERKRAENSLRESEKKYRTLLDTMPHAAFVCDTSAVVQYYNDRAAEIWGREPECGDPNEKYCGSLKLYLPDGTYLPHSESPMVKVLEEGITVKDVEVLIEQPDGRRVPVIVNFAPLENGQGKITGVITSFADITHLKKTEKALEKSNAKERKQKRRYNSIMNATPDLIYVFDLNYRFTYVNEALLKISDSTLEDFLGKTSREAGNEPWHAEMHEREVDKVIETKKPVQNQVTLGEKSYDHVFAPVFDNNGEVKEVIGVTRDITDHKEAEQKALKSEKKYRTLFNSIDEGYSTVQVEFDEDNKAVDYKFLEVNSSFAEQTGLKDAEGKSMRELAPDHEEFWYETYGEVALKREPVRFEHAARALSRFYDVYAFPYGEEKSGKVGVLFNDVTDRKQAEKKLRQSEEKYRTLFDSMKEGYGVVQVEFNEDDEPVDYKVVEINPTAEDLLGMQDVKGKKPNEVLPEYEGFSYEKYGKVVQTREPAHFEKYLEPYDQHYRVSAYPYGPPEERKVAIHFNDITEIKKANEEQERLLREVETERQRLLDVFRDAPSMMAVTEGPHHVFKQANGLYRQLVGYRELIGETVEEALPEVKEQGFVELLDQVYETGEAVRRSYESVILESQDGGETEEYYLDFVYQPIRDAEDRVTGIFIQAVDLTERKKQEEELIALNESLEDRVEQRTAALLSYQKQLRSLAMQLSRAEEEERRRLAAELHDNLGQMLAVTKMKMDFMQKEGKLEDLSETMELVDESIQYTRKLMSDLKPPPSLKEENISGTLKWIINAMEPYDINIHFDDTVQNEPKVGEDIKTTVVQSVRELLFNVVKHADSDEARIKLSFPANTVRITVEDNGKGFDMDNTDFAVTEDGGFGLFHIKERLGVLGGRADIESKPGDGTTVTLIAPLKAAQEAAGQEAAGQEAAGQEAATEQSVSKIKVLLVDDHEMMREGLRKIIEGEDDLTVIAEAADAETAIDAVKQAEPDVVIMDINLPGMNGIEATKIIKDEHPKIKIIGLSFHDDDEVRHEMHDAGASAYLEKANASEALCAAIRSEGMASELT